MRHRRLRVQWACLPLHLLAMALAYEPIHGSAHDITGKGVGKTLASILSAALLVRYFFGMKAESEAVISAVDKVLKDGYRTRDIANATTDAGKILGTHAMAEVFAHL